MGVSMGVLGVFVYHLFPSGLWEINSISDS